MYHYDCVCFIVLYFNINIKKIILYTIANDDPLPIIKNDDPLPSNIFSLLTTPYQMFHFDACVLLLLLLLANSARLLAALEFSLETENVNLLNVTGQIAAFADFNSDTATDILILNATGQHQEICIGHLDTMAPCM